MWRETALAALMAMSSVSATTLLPRGDAGNRNISMWTDDSHTDSMVKFLDVPNSYSLANVKHADHAGMFYTFNNGDTWLTLNSKRLWKTPDYGDDLERGPESPEDWPIMDAQELHEALSEQDSYDDLQAKWTDVSAHNKALQAVGGSQLDSRATCRTVRCHTSGTCYRYSTSILSCYRCHSHRCTIMRLLPNAVKGPSPY